MRSAGFAEMVKMVQDSEPIPPSKRISTLGDQRAIVARRRGIDPNGLTRGVSGDLDWIVLKSLDKDRRRRYESASAFADDVRRTPQRRSGECRCSIVQIQGREVYREKPDCNLDRSKFGHRADFCYRFQHLASKPGGACTTSIRKSPCDCRGRREQ